ncbi:hypothetical protein NLI96_g3916 [Meripilus lineatus]|uniref:Rhodanese domain-containing protein n=1 Tax=Meripilus lineatus TaxID=2056292 RepID=A0AAD5V5L7_9APHY|nr:hypothetical protein NLI96_g3916 [Physisporinus lineatus]
MSSFDDSSETSSTTASYGQLIPPTRPLYIVSDHPGTSSVRSLPNPYSHSQVSTTSSYSDVAIPRAITQPPPPRTLEAVREQVAHSTAFRLTRKAEEVDGSKVGVELTLASSGDGERDGAQYLRLIASKMKQLLRSTSHLFIIGTSGLTTSGISSPIFIQASCPEFIERASVLVGAKFIGRISNTRPTTRDATGKRLVMHIQDLGHTVYDEEALWDVVRKAARSLIDPLVPPPGSMGIRQVLTLARSRLERVEPRDAYMELNEPNTPWPVFLVDIRPEAQRRCHGEIPGALVIERNVLEWRFDPRGKEGDGEDGGRLALADRYDIRVIVFCQEGYTSSLAAASLQDLGLLNATDLIGGFKAWKEEKLPIQAFMEVEDEH